MPRPPLSVDWQAIRGLYLQGVEPLTLANKFAIKISTLNSRIYREKWHEILQGEKKTNEKAKEESVAIARDIWSERRETIRERIHLIGDRMTKVASELPDDQILTKADKIKIATEIAGKSVGLDREEDRNQVNIAILGAIGSSPGTYDDVVQGEVSSQSVTILPATE
jgi:hypothetical protein